MVSDNKITERLSKPALAVEQVVRNLEDRTEEFYQHVMQTNPQNAEEVAEIIRIWDDIEESITSLADAFSALGEIAKVRLDKQEFGHEGCNAEEIAATQSAAVDTSKLAKEIENDAIALHKKFRQLVEATQSVIDRGAAVAMDCSDDAHIAQMQRSTESSVSAMRYACRAALYAIKRMSKEIYSTWLQETTVADRLYR